MQVDSKVAEKEEGLVFPVSSLLSVGFQLDSCFYHHHPGLTSVAKPLL